ncbi:MAG: TonB-dependent receptor plug domain-containing protein, partial [Sediminibacterium sp.]|nr:TonB-dependent receptor plug domain-containing protein [Sediminibacterium sp.]
MRRVKYISKFICLFVIFFLSIHLSLNAQTITGVISDSSGKPLAGASIELKGSNIKSQTNLDGKFTLEPNKKLTKSDRILVSYSGYKSIEWVFNGTTSLILQLEQEDKVLAEVVVTALGIKREEKSLGFAAQTVKENAVKDARTNNWANSLSGKVAGLNIQGTGAGPMGSSRITLRGESSLNLDNNQALIIIDGVPVSNKITGTGFSSHLSQDNPVDYGSAVSDINPDDIEKISVLKGSGATALYGSRAAGGVILITTKSGQRKEKGLGITYNTNISIDQVNRWPDYQFEYGEGRTDTYYSYLNSADGLNTSTGVAAGR